MNVDGEICAYIRGAKNKKQAISIAATVWSRDPDDIASLLRENGLMTVDGEFISPIRLTGKEKPMALWKWMPHRKKIYQQLADDGNTPEEIAKALGPDCTVEIVRKYADSLAKKPSPVVIRKISNPDPQPPAATVSPTLPGPIMTLHEDSVFITVRKLIRDSLFLNEEAMDHFSHQNAPDGYFALGELHGTLAGLARLMGLDPASREVKA